MELHEILNDWCDAATRTNRALREIGTGAQSRRELRQRASVGNGGGGTYTVFTLKLGRGYVQKAHREIESIMQPAAPLTQRWSADKRRRAARRSLRGMMTIYCAELLLEFELAVEARTEWIGRYREFVDHALTCTEVNPERLRVLRQETEDTTAALVTIRDQLRELIKERYPMGDVHGGNILRSQP
ncbi:hypothetical protein ABT301_10105 [Streptomyces sp. NPDC000987]|uniref:hypothetical protein n=1 Tax=Streptomyces sp. NPDC000987 TaxID=3154374 RepID=UPI00331826CC